MPRIFLDYGHGGNDVGAIGNNHYEKDINLAIGKLIKEQLTRHGIAVIESREGNTNPSLKERSSKANTSQVDLSISLHCNAFTDTSVSGIEIFTYDKNARCILLANTILNQIKKDKLYNKNRGVKQSNLHMVREIKGPSVLLEMGFITNESDRKILIEKQKEMAISITKGVLNYFSMTYIEENPEKLYKVQVGAYKNKANAEKMAKELKDKGYNVYIIVK